MCRAYALVAWIWAFIWHLPLDLIKWIMAYILNEDGFRDRMHGRGPATLATEQAAEVGVKERESMKPNLGRTSVQVRVSIHTPPAFQFLRSLP